jgi:hypothetical protein
LSKTPTSVVLICIGPKIINLHRNNIGDTKAAGLIFVSSPHSLSKTPTSVVLICIGPKIINLHRNNIGDTKAAGLINALNAMPGLHNLLELDLGENDIGRKGFEAL